jgi:hypothetical protein
MAWRRRSAFQLAFDETIDITKEVERAKRFAGAQLELGLDRTMISSMAIPARMAQPAVGADFNRDRLNLAIENCGIVCQVLQSEGLRPLHTPTSEACSKPRRRFDAVLKALPEDYDGDFMIEIRRTQRSLAIRVALDRLPLGTAEPSRLTGDFASVTGTSR